MATTTRTAIDQAFWPAPTVGDPPPNIPRRDRQNAVLTSMLGDVESLENIAGKAKTLLTQMDSVKANSVDKPPLTALDGYTNGATVRAGYAINVAGRGYMVTTSGVVGTVAPTHTSLQQVADGTSAWLYTGPVRTPVATTDVPTVSFSARPAALSKRHNPLTQASKFVFSGGVPTASGSGVIIAGYTSKDAGTIITTTPGKNNNNPSVEFMTDAPVMHFNNTAFNMSMSFRVVVEVDGYRLKDSAIMGTGPTSMRLDFSAYPQKARRIKIYWTASASGYLFEGIWTGAAYNVWAPPPSLKAAIIGTSHTSGAGYGNLHSGLGWADYFAGLTGCSTMHNIAQGSSGMNVQLVNRYSWLERIQDVFDLAPDVLFIEGPHNDSGTPDAGQIAANTSFITQVRTLLPATLVVCFGTYSNLLSRRADMLLTETNMAAAVAAIADPMVIFVPILLDPAGAWFVGTKSPVITAMTNGVNAQFTLASAPNVVVGDAVTPFGLVGATGANGVTGTVSAVAANVVTTDIDTTTAGTFATSVGSFFAVNDVWTSQDGLHIHQRAVMLMAQRYADGLRRKLLSIVA